MAPEGTSARPRWLGLPPRIALGFGAAVACLVAAAGASYGALDARAAAGRLVRHTAEAQHATHEVACALLVSRTALEAFLATGEPRHRERHLASWLELTPALAELERVSEQHPEEKPRIAGLAAEVAVVRAEQVQILAAVGRGDLEAARAAEGSGPGRAALERATAALAALDADERRAHAGREAAWARSVAWSNGVFFAALLVLLVLVAVAARLVRDEIRMREAEAAARERALEVQHRIVAVVSHDLRNPLAGLLALAGVLARSELPGRADGLVRRMIVAGARMERLVRDLLEWSRLRGAPAIPVVAREADLAEVCRRMAEELRDRGEGAVELETEGDTRAAFDPDRMEQVVGNLLSNAIRHGTAGAPVRLRSVGTAGEVRVEVENQGPPIPPALRSEIFEPFRQGPGQGGGGFGLGLFIVRAVAEAHGGVVDVQSGQGTTRFVVRLPRAPAARDRAAPPASA